MADGMIEDGQMGFRSESGCMDQIFTLLRICEKTQEKKELHVGSMDLKKAYDRVIREAL